MSPEVTEAIYLARARWDRLLEKNQVMPEHLKPIWDRLLEGPTDSRGLAEVDQCYKAHVEFLKAWLNVSGNTTSIRSRRTSSGEIYWLA